MIAAICIVIWTAILLLLLSVEIMSFIEISVCLTIVGVILYITASEIRNIK